MVSKHETQPSPPAYFYWVDALRGIAAIAVVIFHYHHFFLKDYQSRGDIPELGAFPYAAFLEPIYRHGSIAVELFWVISGFVFVHVYLHKKVSLGQFWLARFARLYPLHFATLLFVAALQLINLNVLGTWQIYGLNDLRHFVLQLFLATNWSNLSRGLSFNGPIWSVSFEMGAYALFFVSLGLVRRLRLVAAVSLCGISLYLSQAAWFDPPLIRKGVFTCAAMFFLGSCTYFVFLYCRAQRHLVLLLALCLGVLALGALSAGMSQLAVVFASTALITLAAGLDLVAGAMGRRLRSLGDISYSLYLVHVPLQMGVLTLVDLAWPGYRGFAHSYWVLPIYVVVSCLLARYVYHAFELPAGRLLRKTFGPSK